MRTAGDYNAGTTALCERALVTVIGNAGFCGRHLYLVGGMVPRYLTVPPLPPEPPHAGTQDIDLAVALALDLANTADYETLASNLSTSGFRQTDQAFRWCRDVDGVTVVLELLCETDQVEFGSSFKPRAGTGSRLQALNVRGIASVAKDHRLVDVTAARVDDGGVARATIRVAEILPFIALKVNAFQNRHAHKDAYDIVYVLQNQPGGPEDAGRQMAASPVVGTPFIRESIDLLRERFGEPGNDGPVAYARFGEVTGDPDETARRSNVAVAVVAQALAVFDPAVRGAATGEVLAAEQMAVPLDPADLRRELDAQSGREPG